MEQGIVTVIVRDSTPEVDSWQSGATCSYRDALAVFRFRLTDDTDVNRRLRSLLQPDELSRAERFRRDEDRRRFTLARGLLRLIAGAYLNQLPAAVRFAVGPNRKPELADAPGWHFNVSHSGEWILLACGRMPVGVDVEYVNPTLSVDDLLPVSFSPDEQAYLTAQTDVRRSFYGLWTRKEALAKATGKGIDDDFHRLPGLDGEHPVTSQVLGRGGRWMIQSVAVADAYPAAVAYQLPPSPDGQPNPVPQFYTVDGRLLIIP